MALVILSICLLFCFHLTPFASSALTVQGVENPDRFLNRYIVVYKQNVTSDDVHSHLRDLTVQGVGVMHTYHIGTLFRGFAAVIENEDVLSSILSNNLIDAVHCDVIEYAIENSCGTTQQPAGSWGIARVSHKGTIDNGINSAYYYSLANTGNGVTAYILDTGIYIQHQDFQGRARYGANFVDDVDTDQNSHGTHCAGTVGGISFGIAKGVRLVAVKVLGAGGSGSTSGVIQGIQWVSDQHQQSGGPSVASMSLGSTTDGGKNAAIAASTAAGVVYSVAAGNSNMDACRYYPASSPDAITAGATSTAETDNGGEVDIRSSFSNIGQCVNIFAPGSEITSCGISSPTSVSIKSGTSMACPHVTGAIALLLQRYPSATAAQINEMLVNGGQQGFIQNVGTGSPNVMLYNGCDEN